MTTLDWDNVARCARERLVSALAGTTAWWGEWLSWQAAQALTGRCPF